MPSYTTSLRLVQPATGEYSGTWGTQVNNGITALVDAAVAGTASITMTAADYTLSNNNGTADEARAMFLVLGGTPGAARNVICPAVSKLYYVTNNTTGGFAQTVKTSAGTGISVPNGASMVLRCDGTNVVEAQNALGSIVLNGGTANGVAYLNASKVVTTGSALVFDGTNLGIGTNSPGAKLHVVGNQFRQNDATGSQGYVINTTSATTTLATLFGGSSFAIQTGNSGTNQLLLDTSGNLGIGVTPSAAIAGTTIEIGVNKSGAFGALGSGPVDNAYVSANAYPTGSADPAFTSWKYTRTGFAAKYEAGRGGAHQWFTAPSGTAGNAITFTQAMTLSAAGNLGLGTVTNPTYLIDATAPSSGDTTIRLTKNGSVNTTINAITGALTFGIDGSGGTTERMRLDANGRLGIGAASPGFPLYVFGPQANPQISANDGNVSVYVAYTFGTGATAVSYFGTGSNHAQAFITNNVERARFASGGDFVVGTATTAGAGGITLFNNGSIGFSFINNNNAGATGYVFSSYRRSSVEIGSVTQNGTTAVLFNTTSDRRLKENIAPAPSASDVIDAIEIVSHDWKSAPDEHVTYGVIAQDLALVAPQAVLQGDDGDEIEKTWGVDYSKLVPMLIKEIQTLRARVAALEAK